MKRAVILVLCMIVSIITFGREKKQFPDEIKGIKVSSPRFIGNEELSSGLNETRFGSLNEFLLKHVQYPEASKDWKDEGTEVVKFVVTTKGEVTDFNILNSVSPEIDKEVIRVLKATDGRWNPGLKNGESVAMEKEVSIAFKFHDEDDKISRDENFVDLAKRHFNKGNSQFFRKNNRKALKHYNIALRYLPNDKCLLAARRICRYELGDKNGALKDCNRIKVLCSRESDYDLVRFCENKGVLRNDQYLTGKEININ